MELLFIGGALLFFGGLLYIIVKVVWYVVRVAGLTGFTLFNFGYHMAVVWPQLEKDGFLARKQAEAEEARRRAIAKAQAEADARVDALVRTADDQRRRVAAAYPLADQALVNDYVDAFMNRTVAEADELEATMAAQQRARACPVFDAEPLDMTAVSTQVVDGLRVQVLSGRDTVAVRVHGSSVTTGHAMDVTVPVPELAAANVAVHELARAAAHGGLTADAVVDTVGGAGARLRLMRLARGE